MTAIPKHIADMGITQEQLDAAIVRAIDKELAERSLLEFTKQAWPMLEPGREFQENWHHAAIARHLEAITWKLCLKRKPSDKIIKRAQKALMEYGGFDMGSSLVINVPPRSTKSILVSVCWPIWAWLQDPSLQFLTGSHADNLATRDAVKSRRLLGSPWFISLWPDTIVLSEDQNEKGRYTNTNEGHRITFGMKGNTTGDGGDILLIDDPHEAKKAMYSDAERQAAINTYQNSLVSRLNDQTNSATVIVQQRVHQDDLSGHVLERDPDSWEHICIPMEYEVNHPVAKPTSLGDYDPRTEPGELLDPIRFPKKAVDRLAMAMGSRTAAGQLQQRPTPGEGGMFDKSKFIVVDSVPGKIIRQTRFWDWAATKPRPGKEPDWTVGTLMGLLDTGEYIVLDVDRFQEEAPGVERHVRQKAALDGKATKIRLEQEPGATGKYWISTMTRVLAGYSAKGVLASGDKQLRADPLSTAVEAGLVYVLSRNWTQLWLDEFDNFPFGKNDDQVDSASGAFQDLTESLPVTIGFA